MEAFYVNFSSRSRVYGIVTNNRKAIARKKARMKRLAFALGIVLATGIPFMGMDGRRFDQKLSKDQRIVHVLNRRTRVLRGPGR